MARAKSINLRGTAERHSDAVDLVPQAGDVALVRRGALRSLTIRCPDGCGEVISVNLDPRAGPAWKLYDREDSLTLFPSVWRESGCEAHFILWRNRLIRCDVLAKRRAQEARSQAAAGARTAEVEQVL